MHNRHSGYQYKESAKNTILPWRNTVTQKKKRIGSDVKRDVRRPGFEHQTPEYGTEVPESLEWKLSMLSPYSQQGIRYPVYISMSMMISIYLQRLILLSFFILSLDTTFVLPKIQIIYKLILEKAPALYKSDE